MTSPDEDSEYNPIFATEKIGVACSCDDPEGVANAILKLKNDCTLRESLADRAKAYGKKYYSRSVNTAKYERLYCKLGNNKDLQH